MRNLLLLTLVVLLLWIGGRWLVYALASDETRIRWMLGTMEEGYNSGDVGDAVGPLARDWSHEGHSLDRELVKGGLIRESLQDRDPETKELMRRVELDGETLVVTVDGDAATLEVEASFARQREGAWETTWRALVSGELRRGEDGWEIHRTRHRDLEGTQLSR
jgi:hypothetical protein